MYDKRQKSMIKHADFMILDILMLCIAYFIGYGVRHGFNYMSGYVQRGYGQLIIVLIAFQLCVMLFGQTYKNIVRRGYFSELKAVITYIVTVDALMLTYLFVLKKTADYSRESLLVFFVLHIIFTYIERCVNKKRIRVKLKKNPMINRMLILVDRKHESDCVEKLVKDEYRNYRVVGVVRVEDEIEEAYAEAAATIEYVDADVSDVFLKNINEEKVGNIPVICGLSEIEDYLLKNVVDSVFINADIQEKQKKKLIAKLVEAGVTVHTSLLYMPEGLENSSVERIGNYTVLTTGMRLATMRQILIKRGMDIFGSIVGCLITMVATVIFGPIIYIQSPGPIFFKQKRMGKNGRVFEIYKFRSMYMDAEERKKELMAQNKMDGLMFKMDNDPRIIPIGRFIRKYSIDELPQFFNVLKGDMSLVGTRPPTVDEFEQYELHHRGRLAEKPGITGLWQVSGRSDITDFEEVVSLDTEYIQSWSISYDIKIICKTVIRVIKGSGAE